MDEYKSYETERLILKPTSAEDAPFVLELLNTPKWLEMIGDRNVHTIEEAEAYIANKMTPQLERLGFSNYTVIRKADGAKLGTCGLYDREALEGVDIGFAFLPQYEKMGFAYESASKIRDLAYQQFGIRQLSAITIEENTSSRRLLEKLGFKYIQTINIPGDDKDLLLYKWEVG